MSKRDLLTALTAAILCMFYCTYVWSVSGLVRDEAPQETQQEWPTEIPVEQAPLTNVEMAEQWLRPIPWAANAQYQLRTADAFIYANEWSPVDADKAVRFRPFAMIFHSKRAKPGEPPVTVISESAYIRFENKFVMSKPDPGRVIGGQLEGEVSIRGPNDLVVTGRNFLYTEQSMRLWSDNPTKFQMGQHRGSGHGLQIDLLPVKGVLKKSQINVAGIKSIRLRRDVRMDLILAPGQTLLGGVAPTPAGKTNAPKPQPASPRGDQLLAENSGKEPVVVQVQSAGSFDYGTTTFIASFAEKVHVVRPAAPGKNDTLDCDRLTLHFEPKKEPAKGKSGKKKTAKKPKTDALAANPSAAPNNSKKTDPTAKSTDETGAKVAQKTEKKKGKGKGKPKKGQDEAGHFEAIETNLELRRLRAQGKDVVLRSELNDLTAHMTDFVYDAQSRVAVLTDKNRVRVIQGGNEIRSPEITLAQDEMGGVSHIWCRGAGAMRSIDKQTGELQIAAQWQRQLRRFPDPDEQFDIIEIEQDAIVRQPQRQMGLAAEFIRLWLERPAGKVAGALSAKSPATGHSSSPVKKKIPGSNLPGVPAGAAAVSSSTRLRKMLALDRVTMVSPQMNAQTKRLEVWFDEGGVSTQPPSQRSASRGGRSVMRDVAHVDNRGEWSAGVDQERGGGQARRATDAPVGHTIRDELPRRMLRERGELRQTAFFDVADTTDSGTRITSGPTLIGPGLIDPSQIDPAQIDPASNAVPGATNDPPLAPAAVRDLFPAATVKIPRTLGEQPGIHREALRPVREAARDVARDAVAGAEVKKKKEAPARKSAPVTGGFANGDGPLDVTANLIRVRVVQEQTSAGSKSATPRPANGKNGPGSAANGSRVAEIWMEGSVIVRQQHAKEDAPLEATGASLHLLNHSETDQVLHIYGAPAHVRDRGVHIEGKNIHLDRGRNLAWVHRAGLLQLPMSKSLEGKKLDAPQTIDIWWKESMSFDGHTARFFGDVKSSLSDNTIKCQAMVVTLNRKFSFTEANGSQGADISRVNCRDGVEFESQEFEKNKLMQVRRGEFAEFMLDQKTGRTEATGPGKILIWRRGRGKRGGFTPNATVGANKPAESAGLEWEYFRVDFNGTTEGNITQRFNTFQNGVKIVYGPVSRPLEPIDPDHLPKDGGWMRCRSLQITQHQTPGQKQTHMSFHASGNAELEGRTFNARADHISYDESQGMYVLRSLGKQKATIWRQKQVGAEYSRADAQRMEFTPAQNKLKLDQATGLEGLN